MLGSSHRSVLSSRTENVSSVDLYGGLGLSDENGAPFLLNASGMSQVGQVAGNSKAVLAALRALQDKIRRLDTERAHAIDEAAQLRQQCKALELEAEHAKQREVLSSQRAAHESRVQQERLYTEKAELEVKLARAEDRIREQARAAAEAEAAQRVVDEARARAEAATREGEERCRALEEQLAQCAAKEKGRSPPALCLPTPLVSPSSLAFISTSKPSDLLPLPPPLNRGRADVGVGDQETRRWALLPTLPLPSWSHLAASASPSQPISPSLISHTPAHTIHSLT